FPVAEMLERTARDNHPPLYFLLLKTWAALFGDSALALRALSIVLGCLTIVGMYGFTVAGSRLVDGKPVGAARAGYARVLGLFVAGLVALSVFQIRWSWDVRMYALGTALAAFSSWALACALSMPTRPALAWFRYGLLALLFAYT